MWAGPPTGSRGYSRLETCATSLYSRPHTLSGGCTNEASSSNLQHPENLQDPNTHPAARALGHFELGAWSFSGCWWLDVGVFRPLPPISRNGAKPGPAIWSPASATFPIHLIPRPGGISNGRPSLGQRRIQRRKLPGGAFI